MSFFETTEAISADIKDFDLELAKISIFAERSYNEYLKNLNDSKLKVMNESGTDEDLTMLENAATEGVIGRTAKIIKKIIESVKEFIKMIWDKITGFISDAKTEAALNKAKESKKGDAKVKFTDFTKNKPNADKSLNKIGAIIAKAKNNRAEEADISELDTIMKSYRENRKAILAAAAVTATVGAAIAFIKSESKNKTKINIIDSIDPDSVFTKAKDINDTSLKALELAIEKASSIIKDNASDSWNAISSAFEAVKAAFAFSDTKSEPSDGEAAKEIKKNMKESVSLSEEQANAILDEVLENVNKVEDSDDDVDDITVEKYLENLEKGLFEESNEDDIKSLVDDLIVECANA